MVRSKFQEDVVNGGVESNRSLWTKMLRNVSTRFVACGLAVTLAWSQQAAGQPWGDNFRVAGNLKIAVIEGNDGVNILKVKIAVRPVVEVRDKWNLPIAGALVTFELPKGKPGAAFVDGKKGASVTTDANGRAAAGDMKLVGKGRFTIEIRASYQGDTGATTITQTNFPTVAAARGTVKIPVPYANALSGTTKGLIVGGLIAGAAAGAAIALAGNKSSSQQNCSSLFNQFSSDLNTAVSLQVGSTQWVSASQIMFNDLGSYCSCAGGPGELASSPTLLQDVQNLLSAGMSAGFAVPTSCGTL